MACIYNIKPEDRHCGFCSAYCNDRDKSNKTTEIFTTTNVNTSQDNNKMSNWVDYDMLMLELEHHRNNATRIVKEYKEIEKPTEWDKLKCKEAVGEINILECLMRWCSDFKFSSVEVKEIIE